MTVTTALYGYERRDPPQGTDYRGKPERVLYTEWVVKTGTTPKGRKFETVVQVVTSHYGKSDLYGYPEKQFRSRFDWVTKEKDDGYSVTTWSSDNKSIRIGEVPADRYSKKGLEQAHQKAVDTVLDIYDGTNLKDVVEQAIEKGGER